MRYFRHHVTVCLCLDCQSDREASAAHHSGSTTQEHACLGRRVRGGGGDWSAHPAADRGAARHRSGRGPDRHQHTSCRVRCEWMRWVVEWVEVEVLEYIVREPELKLLRGS